MAADRIEHMIETLAGPGDGGVDDLTAAELLRAIRDRRVDEDRAAADQLVLAAQWADLHPPESIHDAASFSMTSCGRQHELVGRRTVLVSASGTDHAQQLGGGEVLDPTRSRSRQRLDHVFDSIRRHRHCPGTRVQPAVATSL